jgi:hypothetical protein
MSDNKKKQMDGLIGELLDQVKELRIEIKELRSENRVQNEQVIFKMESVLLRRGTPTPKKPVKIGKNEKECKEKDVPLTFSNTMYWWKTLWAAKDPLVLSTASDEEVKIAEESIAGVKEKSDSQDPRQSIAMAIWKGFDKGKKSGPLKTLYENWKKGNAKLQAKDVEKEKHTDDDEEEEDGGDNDEDDE